MEMTRILIVDDSPLMRQSLKKILVSHGYEVLGEAENGSVALEKFKQLKPDLVTLDISMPEMDGLTTLKEIRKLDDTCKIVMISGSGDETNIRKAIALGANDFVLKPFIEEMVIKKLKKIV